MPVEGTEMPLVIQTRNGRLRFPEFSPTGKFIAFVSDESGRDGGICTACAACIGDTRECVRQRRCVTTVAPRWQRALLRSTDVNGAMMSVDAQENGDVFSAGVPRLLFKAASPTCLRLRRAGRRSALPDSSARQP